MAGISFTSRKVLDAIKVLVVHSGVSILDTKNTQKTETNMQAEPNAKQLVVERIKNSTNILVTVSRNPSVDELSAALGLTLMLNKLDKHATAVFSGAIPRAIDFLEPGKTFENTVDSLRDFIIALDKEKADRLRYKVENDVVRIFITPYKTTITEKDLQFSQGDFNVELIVALGVEKREDIDAAVTAHGRILHDATVVTLNAKSEKGSVGSIDWSDGNASSLCEMLMSLSEALQSGILDQQMSTALLTGIVAATDRFRNEHTSPKVMTMAAQLMAAGANQQLIASKLEEGHELADAKQVAPDGSKHLEEGASEKLTSEEPPKEEAKKSDDGEMTIEHVAPAEPVAEPGADALKEAETELAEQLQQPQTSQEGAEPVIPMTPTLSVEDLKKDLLAASEEVNAAAAPIDDVKGGSSWRDRPMSAPTFGGTLNATTDEAEEEKHREDESNQNHRLLTHDGPASDEEEPPQFDQPVSAVPEPTSNGDDTPPLPDPFAEPIKSEPESTLSYEPTPEPHDPGAQTLSDLEEQARSTASQGVDDARAAVDAALSSMPFDPAGQPMESVGAQPLGEDIRPQEPIAPVPPSEQPVLDAAPPADTQPIMPETPAPTAAPAPSLPPLPDFTTLPPLPGEEQPQPPNPAIGERTYVSEPTTPPPTAPTDPGQFQLPGQQ